MKPDNKTQNDKYHSATNPVSYTPNAVKRDDIPALEQHNYIQDRQPTYMRVSVNEKFDKKTHRHWVSNLFISIFLILLISAGYYWWTNMDGKYFFHLVPLATYSDSDISIALPKNYQQTTTENANQKNIKYYLNNAGDKVLALEFVQTKSKTNAPVDLRDARKAELEKNIAVTNIATNNTDQLYYLSYDVKKADVITKHVKEIYFVGKINSYKIVFYDDMINSDYSGSISDIIKTLEIK